MKYLIICAVLLNTFNLNAQKDKNTKLLVGIVIDQMRYDYLEKFAPYFSEDGFNKLKTQGFSFSNIHYNYKPTYTGPGHATIFSGVYPSLHGIIGNNWYSRDEVSSVYCVKVKNDTSEMFAPSRMKSKTLGDIVKQNSSAKVYGISLKDRGAILPIGKDADAAYWFNSKSGNWESSKYYKNQNQDWLSKLNKQDFKEKYLSQNWYFDSTLNDVSFNWINQESESKTDIQDFDYNLKEDFQEVGFNLLKSIPQGNQMTLDLALDLITNEGLGKDSVLDMLSISFSATDYVGHKYGVESKEVFDTYLKLDKTIAELIEYLDGNVGEGNYLLFLTSDHGAGVSKSYLSKHGVETGYLDVKNIKESLDSILDIKFGKEDWVETIQNLNIYFTNFVKDKYANMESDIIVFAKNFLENHKGINKVFGQAAAAAAEEEEAEEEEEVISSLAEMAKNGVNAERSGDLILIEQRNWNTYSDEGSTHGTPYDYDTHVPLLFYGGGISQGNSDELHHIVDIAPTIIQLLNLTSIDKHSGHLMEFSGKRIEELE